MNLTMRLMILGLLAAAACLADTRFYVNDRGDFQNGQQFGKAGVYEFIVARLAAEAGEGWAEVLKPRDPALGNGTVVIKVNPPKGKYAPPVEALNSGVTLITLTWKDAATLQAGVAELVNFLKYKGGPMLLGDQRRFLKRAVVVDNALWVAELVKSGRNKNDKGQVLIDALLPASAAGSVDLAKAQPVQ